MFTTTLPIAAWILMGLTVLSALMAILYGLRPYLRAAEFSQPEENEPDTAAQPLKCSVIMYCQGSEEEMMQTLEAISHQDYENFEVILVCEADEKFASYINERLKTLYGNVYVTFVQPGSHNLSRRKLANTIGIKAAKGDVVLTTVSNITIPSERWISSMMKPFANPSIDFVLGVTHIDNYELKGIGRGYKEFDTSLTNGMWVGYAAAGAPYRGDSHNMAFRRRIFFEQKGYAKTMYLQNGDDDVFLRDLATGDNTVVTVCADNIVVTEWGESANRIWAERKESYAFTSRWLRKAPFIRSGMMELLQWLVPGLGTAAALTAWPSVWGIIVGAVSTICMWIFEVNVYNRLAARFGVSRRWLGVVVYWLWRPVGNLIFKLSHIGSRKKNFTWPR